MDNFKGSICLTDIPKELITTANNGKKYLNVYVNERKTPGKFGATHYIKCAVKKADQKPDVNYFIGDLQRIDNEELQVANPVAQTDDQLPF